MQMLCGWEKDMIMGLTFGRWGVSVIVCRCVLRVVTVINNTLCILARVVGNHSRITSLRASSIHTYIHTLYILSYII